MATYYTFSQSSGGNNYLISKCEGSTRGSSTIPLENGGEGVTIGNNSLSGGKGHMGTYLSISTTSVYSSSISTVYDTESGSILTGNYPLIFSNKSLNVTVLPFLWIPSQYGLSGDVAAAFVGIVNSYVTGGVAGNNYYYEGAKVGVALATAQPNLNSTSTEFSLNNWTSNWPSTSGTYIDYETVDYGSKTFGEDGVQSAQISSSSQCAYCADGYAGTRTLYPYASSQFWTPYSDEFIHVFGTSLASLSGDVVLPVTSSSQLGIGSLSMSFTGINGTSYNIYLIIIY